MMLSEDPDTVSKRRELRDRKHRLELALQKITDLDPGIITPPPYSLVYPRHILFLCSPSHAHFRPFS